MWYIRNYGSFKVLLLITIMSISAYSCSFERGDTIKITDVSCVNSHKFILIYLYEDYNISMHDRAYNDYYDTVKFDLKAGKTEIDKQYSGYGKKKLFLYKDGSLIGQMNYLKINKNRKYLIDISNLCDSKQKGRPYINVK